MKRNRDKARIDIDLTSMLDVIFIILIVVMCSAQFTAVSAQQAAEESMAEDDERQAAYEELVNENEDVKREYEEVKEQLDTFEEHKEMLENVNTEVAFVTLHADYDTADPKVRHFRLVKGDAAVIDNIEVTPENEEKAFEELLDKLSAYLSENEDKPVLMTLSDEQILYRDYNKLYEMLQGIDTRNLFIEETSESGESEE